jgi:uncharacterized protein YaiI (UPF0178 family)
MNNGSDSSLGLQGFYRSGPKPYSDRDKQTFANALDRLLARL